jgi:uncharacterized protein (DUF342 family)
VSERIETFKRVLCVHVADDRLKAWIEVRGLSSSSFEVPTAEEVVAVLEDAKLVVTDAVRLRAEKLVGLIRNAANTPKGTEPPRLPDRFLMVEGVPPKNAVDGRFEWSPELTETITKPLQGERIDYFAVNAIVTVVPGTFIGWVVPPEDGAPSVDVFGVERPPRKAKGAPVKLGPGVSTDPGAAPAGASEQTSGQAVGRAPPAKNAVELFATSAGRVVQEADRVWVDEVLSVADVDFDTGSLDVCVDVLVNGTVRSNFTVRTTKSLRVAKVIEAAKVDVDGHVLVQGGIFGQNTGRRVRAGGNLAAKLLNESVVEVGGDLQVGKEILNSRVRVGGHLRSGRGTVIGGVVGAREGMELRAVGSEAGVATTVEVGMSARTMRRVKQIERQVKDLGKSAAQVRQAVQPLLANMRRLLPGQRERTTELMGKADEIERQVARMKEEARRLISEGTPTGSPYILINEIAHPGTRLRIGAREVDVRDTLYGPVRVELRKVDGATEMVAVNQRTGSVTTLPAVDVDLDEVADEPVETGEESGTDETADN